MMVDEQPNSQFQTKLIHHLQFGQFDIYHFHVISKSLYAKNKCLASTFNTHEYIASVTLGRIAIFHMVSLEHRPHPPTHSGSVYTPEASVGASNRYVEGIRPGRLMDTNSIGRLGVLRLVCGYPLAPRMAG